MIKKSIPVLIGSLMATGVFAGPTGAITYDSTTTTISADLNNVEQCLISAYAINSDSGAGLTASAVAKAVSDISISFSGDVTVDITRHGKHGAVHLVALNGKMESGTLFVHAAESSAQTEAETDVFSSATVNASVSMIANALATLFLGGNWNLDLEVIEITVKAGSEAHAETHIETDAQSEGSAFASANASADSDSSASASVTGSGDSAIGTTFYVQGANIEEFTAQLGLSSGMLLAVKTEVLTEAYANAIATSMAYALAEASAEAEAGGELSFFYDLPILGSGSLPIVTDYASASTSAQVIVEALDAITAQAEAIAQSSADTLAASTLDLSLSVQYEKLPGTTDLLQATAAGDLQLNCDHALTLGRESTKG